MSLSKETLEAIKKAVSGWVVGQKGKQKKRGVPWKWIAGFGVAIVSLIALAGLSFILWRKGREIAKLKHERDITKQNEKRAIAQAQIEENNKKIDKLRAKASDLNVRISEIDIKLEEVKKSATIAEEKIHALKNWEDVDRLLSGDSDPPTNASST